MKSLRASTSDDYKSSLNRYNQSSKSSNVSASANMAIAANQSSNTGSTTKKHSFGLRRFSLRRIFNPTSIGRTVTNKHRTASSMKDTHSESGSASDNKSVSNAKIGVYRATCSYDAESYSISSARSEYFHSQMLPPFMDANGSSSSVMECPLCLLEQPSSHFPELFSCSHRACLHCLQQYLKIEILESRVNIHCPECTEPIHPNDIQRILNYDLTLVEKYETFMLRRILITEPDARWCPAPDCGYVVIASGCASCPKLKCERPGCETSFCYHCKQEWHPNQTCDAARAQRGLRHSTHAKSSSISFSHDSIIQRDDIKPCPCCKVLIIKMDDGSCNHITCSVCGTEFCWLCMKEISDLHYLSPSGCTFWGKKPWSRKKKIMWQLGMLVGAPVGIALIAGIAVPAIIIGIPVWVGRKLHARFERHQMSRHKRNILVTTGVLTSIFVSPILAAVAVGIGVPILLAYVYGVVPISLCRSGGCGVTTSASGVRIELDEENEIGIGANVAPDGVSVDTALSNRGVNPSIGEVSLGMSASVSMGSGTHLDRLVGVDRENSSTAACAGSIASGSLSIAHKVEVQADVTSNKRFSLSSHSETASATLSFGDRAANVDDASVKALAGSIIGYREATISNCRSNSVTPVEVHVDAAELAASNEHEAHCNSLPSDTQSERFQWRMPCRNGGQCSDYCSTFADDVSNVSELMSGQTAVGNASQTKYLIGKYESRSLEHLTNYCELCHKTHRPCCPNYVYSQNVKPLAQSVSHSARRRQSKSVDPSDDEQRRAGKKSYLSKRRNSSVKSKQSNSFNSKQKGLKRIHSSDCNITDSQYLSERKSSVSSLPFRSTPTSPTDAQNIAPIDHRNSQQNRAYYQNSFSKYFHHKKGQQNGKTLTNNTPSYTTINIDEHDFCMKSSQV